jgi:hypothetical protein
LEREAQGSLAEQNTGLPLAPPARS